MRLTDELDNLRACFAFLVSRDRRAALQLAVALERYWIAFNPSEGRDWLQSALEPGAARDELRAEALYDAAFWAVFRGYFDEARGHALECFDVAQELGSDLHIGLAYAALAVVDGAAAVAQWSEQSLALFERAEQHIRRAGDVEALGRQLNNYGQALSAAGRIREGRAKIEEALALAETRGDTWQLPAFLDSLAAVEAASGESAAARAHWRQVLESEFADRPVMASALTGLAGLALSDERPQRYLPLLGAASSLLKAAGIVDADIAAMIEEGQRRSRASLGERASEALWQSGIAMTREEAIRFALDECGSLSGDESPMDGAPRETTENGFVREGELWLVTYRGTAARIRDSKGVRDIARLLTTPSVDVAAVDLAGGDGFRAGGSPAAASGLELSTPGHAGEVLDAQAREQYRARLRDLEEEVAEAESGNDPERASRARDEQEFLLAELRAAVGLSGRPRLALDPAERARKAVTARIRDAIGHIEVAHPPLGRHLRHSVRTGSFCAYDPAEPIPWRV